MSQSVKFPPKRDIFAFIWLQSIPQMPRNGEEGISEAIYRNNALSPVAFHPSPWYPGREKKGMYFWKQQVPDVSFISRYIACVQIDI